MTSVIDRPPTTEPPRSDGSLSAAWIAVLLIPVFFAIAFAAATALYSLTGHDPSAETPPHWADLVAIVPAGLLFALPCAAAVFYGRRAVRAGKRWGFVPIVIGVVAAVGFALLSAL